MQHIVYELYHDVLGFYIVNLSQKTLTQGNFLYTILLIEKLNALKELWINLRISESWRMLQANT